MELVFLLVMISSAAQAEVLKIIVIFLFLLFDDVLGGEYSKP